MKTIKRTPALILIGVLLLTPIFLVLLFRLPRLGKEQVIITVAPSSADVFINGDKRSSGTHYLSPGTHTILIAHAEFDDYSEKINVEKGVEIPPFTVGLAPSSFEGQDIANGDRDQYLLLESLTGDQASKEGLEFSEKNPILAHLPYVEKTFKINHGVDKDNSTLVLYITPLGYDGHGGGGEAISSARAKIRKWGYEPDSYKTVFKNGLGLALDQEEESYSIKLIENSYGSSRGGGKYTKDDFNLLITLTPSPLFPLRLDEDVHIQDLEGAKKLAFQSIKKKGYNPSDFRIEYIPSIIDKKHGTNN